MRLVKLILDPMVFLIVGSLGGTIIGLLLTRAILVGRIQLTDAGKGDGLFAMAQFLFVLGSPFIGLLVGLFSDWCAGALVYAVRMLPHDYVSLKHDI